MKKPKPLKIKPNRNTKRNTDKQIKLEVRSDDQATLTTNQGLPISDNQNSLKVGARGPTLLEDFILREKITHFDHERIPERIVHARGSAAHGFFELTNDMSKYTKAGFLNGPKGKRTPIFARFSTVQGGSSSADSVRDVRGFAVKFYTEQGNYDFVGNNIPVFFIQDAIKFPDLVHAVKMEPHHGMPQGGSAHDNFWDFVSLMPESTHMLMWAMSDRGIPRSLRMIQGFGVHTFRFINEKGKSVFVKFHLKPEQGVHSLVWDEAQKLNGKDPDYHRRDLWESINQGYFPAWQFFAQLFESDNEVFKGVDLLDPTKLIPEELSPLIPMGRLVLDRNPDNFFAETEQVAFHPGHVVPGIDFSNDPLLQGRLFSYTDTQLSRLGGPNFHELPINQAKCPVHNNQRDGIHRQTIVTGRVNYEPNSLQKGCPMQSAEGFATYSEKLSGLKARERPNSFSDHFSQAKMFFDSQTESEKNHIIEAFSFELTKVQIPHIREQIVSNLVFVDETLAKKVADNLGLDFKAAKARGFPKNTTSPKSSINIKPVVAKADSLSLQKSLNIPSIDSRRIAIVALDDVAKKEVDLVKEFLKANKLSCKVITLTPVQRSALNADELIQQATSVEFDGFVILGEQLSKNKKLDGLAQDFITEGFKHLKTIEFVSTGAKASLLPFAEKNEDGLLVSKGKFSSKAFLNELKKHKHWSRE